MKKRTLLSIATLLLSLLSSQALAVSLTEAFQAALKTDPTIKNARALVEVAQAGVPIARSSLLPALDISGTAAQQRTKQITGDAFNNKAASYDLTLNQPIFNYAGWMAVKNANALVKQAVANYYATVQQVMFDTSRAYFSVLEANDALRFTVAEKRSLERQLEQSEERFKVGLVAITDVLEVRAQYDAIRAQEISVENDIANNLENLREFTGKSYTKLDGPTRAYPLVTPQPANINRWVQTALKQNYTIHAAGFQVLSDRANIKQQAAARYPVLSAIGSFSGTYQNRLFAAPVTTNKLFTNTGAVGVALSFPAYQGGLIGASTKQARQQLNADSAVLEKTIRFVSNQTRQSYLNVITGVSKIQADKQAIVSNRKALEATEAAFTVGQRTMVDVLLQQSQLYRAEQLYAIDQYAYILDGLQLKQFAGTLSVEDLQAIDRWLTKKINVAKYSRRAQGINGNVTKVSNKPSRINKKQKITSAQKSKPKANNGTSQYRIQLMSTISKQGAQQFIKHYKLSNAKIAAKQIAGQTRYVVLSKPYAGYKQAKAALAQLPKPLQALKPWITKQP